MFNRFDSVMGIALKWLMRKKERPPPPVRIRVDIDGLADEVIDDFSRFTAKRCNATVRISTKVKALEGSWLETYELPIIASMNTTPAKRSLDGLFRQGRINKEQFDELNRAVDRMAPCAKEKAYEWEDSDGKDRYRGNSTIY